LFNRSFYKTCHSVWFSSSALGLVSEQYNANNTIQANVHVAPEVASESEALPGSEPSLIFVYDDQVWCQHVPICTIFDAAVIVRLTLYIDWCGAVVASLFVWCGYWFRAM